MKDVASLVVRIAFAVALSLLFGVALSLFLTGCSGWPHSPPSPNPVVRTVKLGGRLPVALDVYNPNAFDVLATVHCAFHMYEDEPIAAHSRRRFPITLGDDGTCDVEFWRMVQP